MFSSNVGFIKLTMCCNFGVRLKARKQNFANFFTLKALAVHPLLCYLWSMKVLLLK